MYQRKESNERKSKGGLLAWFFVLVLMAAIAIGDVEQGPMEASASESIEAVAADVGGEEGTEGTSEVQTAEGEMLKSINFNKDETIKNALRVLSAKYQKNIVPSVKVDGILGFTTLSNVSFEEAMDAVLGPNLKYEQDGNLIKVYTKDEYQKMKEDKDRMIYKVFTLYYISAAEAMKLITPVLSGAGSIQGSSPAETIAPTGESISVGTGGGDSMALNDHIVVMDYPENIAGAAKLLKELDVRPMQVLVEATILSATLTEETALGIDWNTLNGVTIDTIGNIGAGIADGLSTSGFGSATKTSISQGGLSAGVTNDHVAALIRALESVTDITILANPKVLAINKQLGQVYIGKKIGYLSQTTQTQTSTTQQVEFLDTGTKLSFRPYIGNDGYIRMDIHPKDSAGEIRSGEQQDIPDETSTELATNIMVKDGQTIVIGGLFRDVVNTTRNQVPLLGDLPFVGVAFRGTVDKMVRQEVIVMLTPHIIEEPEETGGEARVADISRKRFGAKGELQWVDRSNIAEYRYSRAAKYYLEGDSEAALREVNSALEVRPAYLEAIRLKERIIREIDPDEAAGMERNVLSAVEQEESELWMRR